MFENAYQTGLIRRIQERFPGSTVIKNDPNYRQGFPDLTVFYKDKWAALECKASASAKHQPNQDYYVQMLNDMSFAAFIYPENEEEVFREMAHAFRD